MLKLQSASFLFFVLISFICKTPINKWIVLLYLLSWVSLLPNGDLFVVCLDPEAVVGGWMNSPNF